MCQSRYEFYYLTDQHLLSRTSATNGARLYNSCLSRPETRPVHPDWPPERSFKLTTEQVWDGFIILSLLEDYAGRNAILRVPHGGDQNDRFTEAMRERNERIRTYGQPELSHYCDKCLRVWETKDGHLSTICIVQFQSCSLLFFPFIDREDTRACNRRNHDRTPLLRCS